MKRKPYWQLTTSELAEATKQFDEPMVLGKSRRLTADEMEQWKKAKRKRGRPSQGQGFRRISVSIEQGLLRRATVLAKKRGVSRSKLVALALERELQ